MMDLTAKLAEGQQQMQQMQVQMQQQIAMMQQQMAQQNVAMQEQLRIQASAAERGTHRDLVDIKGVGKPERFSSVHEDWPAWAYQFGTWLGSSYESSEKLLDWAEARGEEAIDDTDIVNLKIEHPGVEKFNSQLHALLVSLTTRGTEAFEIVRNSKKNYGLDSWRRLACKYSPNSPQAQMQQLKRILHPPQVELTQLRMSIESWDRQYRTYKEKTREELSDGMQRMCVMAMCPTRLREHLELSTGTLNTYDKLRIEIMRYLEAHLSTDPQGAAPMEIGALTHSKGGKKGGKGGRQKGKGSEREQWGKKGGKAGRSNSSEELCHRCGKKGHFKSECYAKYDAAGKPLQDTAKGKGKGKDSKGKKGGKGVHELSENGVQAYP